MGKDKGLACAIRDQGSPPRNPVDSLTPKDTPNEPQERDNPDGALGFPSRRQPDAHRGRIPQEAKAGGNAPDTLTWGRLTPIPGLIGR